MAGEIEKIIDEYSDNFDYSLKKTAVILAAGHGKRIKSQTSKMLHKIWGIPTVERVFNACKFGLGKANIIIVVGIKAGEVVKTIGKKPNTLFVYQEEQLGTGHALQRALSKIKKKSYDGTLFVFPGDMGLIDKETVRMFDKEFEKSAADMMVLTGQYTGETENNYYGRILRAKKTDAEGREINENEGKVIEIIEHKDILALKENKKYKTKFGKTEYSFSKRELLENREYNSGVFAFKFSPLSKLIGKIRSNNAQNEIYITDLISIFNNNGFIVGAVSPQKDYVIMGFNNKSVLKKMEAIARELVYEKIKDLVEIEDHEDFFIADETVEQIIKMDKKGKPLDIFIGKGVYIGKNVTLNYNLKLMKNTTVDGNVVFGKNIKIHERVLLNTFPNQTLKIGDNVEIFWGDIVKGNLIIGDNVKLESGVNVTGSDEFPCRIGNNVIIKGTSYVFGSLIDDDIYIEHSVLIKKRVHKITDAKGEVMPVRFYIPYPEGVEAVEIIKK
jgi:bifunctional UDP-N-acetylglucosamine pyrophosphorylase/glucosamine-1-phosphate N-acetyltransferase